MLIVLSGSESIHKRFLLRKIAAAVNTFTVDGYTVDFNTYPFRVLDSNNEVVLQAKSKSSPLKSYDVVSALTEEEEKEITGSDYGSGIDKLLSELDGESTLDTILQMEKDLFVNDDTWYRNDLSTEAFDFNLLDFTQWPTVEQAEYNNLYNQLIASYNSKTVDNYVVAGIFGKYTIEKLRADLGAENVHVVNIIRNPSAAWFMHQKDPAYYSLDKSALLEGVQGDKEKFIQSVLASASLIKLDYVQTVKFEDMLVNGLTVLGKQVSLPVGYESYNNIITQFEKDNIVPRGLATTDIINSINTTLSSFSFADIIDASEYSIDNSTVNAAFPSNLFTELGYTALTHDQIVAS